MGAMKPDYDRDPERFRTGQRVTARYARADAAVFGAVDVDAWDAPLVRLPDRAAVRDYLIARFVPRDDAARRAEAVAVPVDVTKRGCVVYARR